MMDGFWAKAFVSLYFYLATLSIRGGYSDSFSDSWDDNHEENYGFAFLPTETSTGLSVIFKEIIRQECD